MTLLATITPRDEDTESKPVDRSGYTVRLAARGIVFDGDKVALIHVSKFHYYMLPGGGLDNDGLETGLTRELREELDCDVRIMQEIGSTETYFDRWQKKQIDRCFMATKLHDHGQLSRTDFEVSEGHEIVWANTLDDAIHLVQTAEPESRDGEAVRSRDLIFLQAMRQSVTTDKNTTLSEAT